MRGRKKGEGEGRRGRKEGRGRGDEKAYAAGIAAHDVMACVVELYCL